MRKSSFMFLTLLLLSLLLPLAGQAQPARPVPCLGDAPNVYLIIDGTRRHIVDWDTFLNLGYQQTDIVPCGSDNADPLGSPITRLFKGSTPEVYWLQNSIRHHVPDMDTFTTLGFRQSEISVLPDDILADWPLGTPLQSLASAPGDTVYDEQDIGSDTIRLWHPGQGLTDFATISAPGQPIMRVEDVQSIAPLPAADITGDGFPDVEFLTRYPGSHCCTGTIIYSLAPTPVKVLDIHSMGDNPAGGRGEFVDVDGDSRYEFILQDPLNGIACTQPSVTAILAYDAAGQRYVGASPRFASDYTDEITLYTASAASGAPCDVYPLITTLIYAGNLPQAQTEFAHFYHGADSATVWASMKAAAESGQFYTPAS